MENGDPKLDRWVGDRIAHLEAPAGWQPDARRGLARLHRKEHAVRRRRRLGLGLAGFAALASALFTIPGCQAATCKQQSDNLAERLWKTVFVPSRPQVVLPKSPAPTAAPPANFKRSGSPSAKVTCEIYTDYECPACARLYLEVVPQLNADYVATGKVALLHRDFPLDRHPHARMAAQYANAAGTLGQYDTAVLQLFRTQMSWGLTGDLDGRLAEVLDAAAMAKVRDLVHADPDLDSSVAADLERGRADGIMHTPSIVVVSNGERRVLPSPDYAALKSVLDEFLRP